MKVFLAMGSSGYVKSMYPQMQEGLLKSSYLLQSFYYITKPQLPVIQKVKEFLLDSGAFTYMNSGGRHDINSYIDRYIEFINKYDIQQFFELDTDAIHGLKNVERFRKKIEDETHKKCIPVWHKSRGIQYYIDLCKEYSYIAIGGIVTKEITKKDYAYFPTLLQIAKKHNCKVHGLGFTSSLLSRYKFYSVDSTSWSSGARFGTVYYMQNGNMIANDTYKKGGRVKDPIGITIYNLQEWIKFQKYADSYL